MPKKYLLLVVVVAALVGGAYLTQRSFVAQPAPGSSLPENAAARSETATSSAPAEVQIVTLRAGNRSYGARIRGGESVLDLMRALEQTTDLTFIGREFAGLGFFVESINGTRNADGSYWFLYVNGISSDTGASQTALRPGDSVEWRYQQSH